MEDINYWTFVLGYDLLQEYIKNNEEPESDLAYKFCNKLAKEFMESEEYKNTAKSGYDMLVEFLKNRNFIN